MNAFERVMNTIQGLPVDRVPVFCVLGTYGANLTGADLHTLYSDAAAHVAGQQALQEAFGLDLVIAPFDYSAIAEAFGSEIAWFDDQVPNMKRPAVSNAIDALALHLPDPQSTCRLPMHLKATRGLADIYKDKVPVFGIVPGPCALPALLMGLENWMETILFDQENAQKIMEHTGLFWVKWANALFAAGITALVVTEGMIAAEIAPRHIIKAMVIPHLHSTFAQVNGPLVLHHTGGRINPVIDLVPAIPGVLGVVIGSKDDLCEARRLIGPDLLLIGNIDNLSIPTATAQNIHDKSMECLGIAAPGGRYILSHSGADLPIYTPAANIHAMLEASVAYAKKDPHS